ncbi:MAG: hypothetical protein ACRD3D_12015, partial [Terriglobia bacterium]
VLAPGGRRGKTMLEAHVPTACAVGYFISPAPRACADVSGTMDLPTGGRKLRVNSAKNLALCIDPRSHGEILRRYAPQNDISPEW